jgi:hypothetical protein
MIGIDPLNRPITFKKACCKLLGDQHSRMVIAGPFSSFDVPIFNGSYQVALVGTTEHEFDFISLVAGIIL